MARKKAVQRKHKKSTKRKRKVTTTENAADVSEAAADEALEQENAAAKQAGTTESPKRRSAAGRAKTGRRSMRKKAARAAADGAVAASPSDAAASAEKAAAPAQPAKPSSAGKRRARKRRAAKARRTEATADAKAVDQASAPPPVKAVYPSAKVEQSEDTIVIRFPSAAPPTRPAPAAPAAPAAEDETALEPPIDWEVAEQPAPATNDSDARRGTPAPDEPLRDDEPYVALTGGTDETPKPATDKGEVAPARPKRRRRRKKKDPRLAPEKETPADERPEAQQERQRPEPTVELTVAAEPAAEEKPARRRRRRSRRARKPQAGSVTTEGDDATAEEAGAKAERPGEVIQAAAPSGQKEMIINVVPHEECRIAIVEGGKLQQIYLERASAENHVGNIYKGIVTNVEPSIQAAFIDFGQGKNGFLHISDLHPQYFPTGSGNTENVGRKLPRRSRPPIQRCLRRGQQLLAQITKEGIGTKGPTLTTYLSIPGRFLVMMPGMRQLGVSRKIEDDEARHKLRSQLLDLDLPENIGFIARTAALDRTKRELQSDLNYLSRLWKAVQKRIESQKAPAEIYTESDLVTRTIRDVYTSDITRIVVDDHATTQRAHEFLSIFSPRSRDIVVEYEQPEPIFHRYGIEAELERLHSRHVPLKSGGSLVIDQTEALVAVDVNSGRFRTEDDAETTAYKIDLEAADEIPRQLRLRDLGGVVICDFIDVRQEKHKREIERRLNRNLKEHKERAELLRMSDFGIIELTRQRQRASLTRSVYQDCRHCHGSGLVKTAESVALDVMRLIQLAVTRDNIRSVEVSVSAKVADLLQNRKRAQLQELETKNQRSISIRTDPSLGLDEIRVQCCDPRGRIVSHA